MQKCKDKSKAIMGVIIVILLIIVFYSFNSEKNESEVITKVTTVPTTETSPTSDNINSQPSNPDALVAASTDTEYVVNVESSDLKWEGFKIVTNTSHVGGVSLKSGSIFQDAEGNITAGNFVIDMTSITDTDIKDEDNNSKIITHLGSEDFFNIAEYSTAILEITNVQVLPKEAGEVTHQIAGNLTIKGITHNISFPAVIKVENGILTAQAKLGIDRTLWDIRFGSLKFGPDAIVKDVMELTVSLVANK